MIRRSVHCYGAWGKRLLDLSLSVPAVLLMSPFYGALAIFVWWQMGWPVLFCQRRPGRHGQIFTLYKFRTMNDSRDCEGRLLPDADRLTAFGRFLRSSSLDELPELLNVVKGEISLVGPRPLLTQYLDRYTPEQARRHEVKPGMTGWAQVNGRNALAWDAKFELDVWYVDHMSFWLDVKILALTVLKVFQREGITQPGQATAQEFLGTAIER